MATMVLLPGKKLPQPERSRGAEIAAQSLRMNDDGFTGSILPFEYLTHDVRVTDAELLPRLAVGANGGIRS